MIVLLDGTFAVGKSTIASRIKEKLQDKIEYLDSDLHWNGFLKNLLDKATKFYLPPIEGLDPQSNRKFINQFAHLIEEREKATDRIIIVAMALTQKQCKEGILEYLMQHELSILHIILLANIETIRLHVANDSEQRQEKAISEYQDNISFFNHNYENATRIQVDNKTADETADEIIDLIKQKIDMI